jgi:hypothetical protein
LKIKRGTQEVTETSPTQDILIQFGELVAKLKTLKGDMRSEEARYIAITITEVEKALGMFNTFVHESYNDR